MSYRSTLAQTKFQMPMLRSDLVARDELVGRLCRMAAELPCTLVCAPAGYGKSTLAAAAARRVQQDGAALWIALDEDDNDINRFGATLLCALDSLDLEWELDPEAVLQLFAGPPPQVRQALNALVNALCSRPRRRIVLFLDDFHHLDDPALLAACDYLLERLPGHAGLVLAARREPALSLARLRLDGRHGRLGTDELRFSREHARRYLAASMDAPPREEALERLLARTDGWIAGLLLGAAGADLGRWAAGDAAGRLGDAQIFDFLAQEVLAVLPRELQEFALQCSVLPDMSPVLCDAVTGRTDGARCLDELYRRNLFVVMVDALTPVMRFHDLFRDFLQHRLRRADPGLAPLLHARAARAEPAPLRRIGHYLQAQLWSEAAAEIIAHGRGLIHDGATSTVLRLLEQLPAAVREADPELRLLQGQCCWSRWDMAAAAGHFDAAAVLYRHAGNDEGRLATLLALSAVQSSSGQLAQARASLEEVAASGLKLDRLGYLPLGLLWLAAGEGDAAGVRARVDEIVGLLEQPQPERLVLATFDLLGACVHCHFTGLAGSARLYRRLHEIVNATPALAAIPAHRGMAASAHAWSLLWDGRPDEAHQAALQAQEWERRAGGVRGLRLDICQLRVLYHGFHKQAAEAQLALRDIAAEIAGASGYRETWTGAYLHLAVRLHWMLDAPGPLRESCDAMLALDGRHEWPFMRGARLLAMAYRALGEGELEGARGLLEQACAEQARYPMPAFSGDARLALAHVWLQLGEPGRAWTLFFEVIGEIGGEGALGPLVFENRKLVARLFQCAPPGLPPHEAALLAAVSRRYKQVLAAPREDARSWRHSLTRREHEILALIAGGASNQRIADELFLSVFTVKRHAANINAKLGVTSRGQAAALFRGAA